MTLNSSKAQQWVKFASKKRESFKASTCCLTHAVLQNLHSKREKASRPAPAALLVPCYETAAPQTAQQSAAQSAPGTQAAGTERQTGQWIGGPAKRATPSRRGCGRVPMQRTILDSTETEDWGIETLVMHAVNPLIGVFSHRLTIMDRNCNLSHLSFGKLCRCGGTKNDMGNRKP
eukprot:1147406-Pelagomonas_calceolata.AAC.3